MKLVVSFNAAQENIHGTYCQVKVNGRACSHARRKLFHARGEARLASYHRVWYGEQELKILRECNVAVRQPDNMGRG